VRRGQRGTDRFLRISVSHATTKQRYSSVVCRLLDRFVTDVGGLQPSCQKSVLPTQERADRPAFDSPHAAPALLDITALNPTQFVQPSGELLSNLLVVYVVFGLLREYVDPGHRRLLLRLSHQRASHRAREPYNELPPSFDYLVGERQ
jgi:hypothetical protein